MLYLLEEAALALAFSRGRRSGRRRGSSVFIARTGSRCTVGCICRSLLRRDWYWRLSLSERRGILLAQSGSRRLERRLGLWNLAHTSCSCSLASRCSLACRSGRCSGSGSSRSDRSVCLLVVTSRDLLLELFSNALSALLASGRVLRLVDDGRNDDRVSIGRCRRSSGGATSLGRSRSDRRRISRSGLLCRYWCSSLGGGVVLLWLCNLDWCRR